MGIFAKPSDDASQTVDTNDNVDLEAEFAGVESLATEISAELDQAAENTEVVQVNEPVDGTDDNMKIDGQDTDVKLKTGNFTAQRAHNKTQTTLAFLENSAKFDRRSAALQNSLEQFKLVNALEGVAQDHNLSAPVVAAFRATPGFVAAVESFPDTALFNIVHESKTSERNVQGLESLSAAITSANETIRTNAAAVVTAFDQTMTSLDDVVANLKVQITQAKTAFEASELTDEVMATLPVQTLHSYNLGMVLGNLDTNLKSVDLFNVDDLMANPEQLKDEVKGLESMVTEMGVALGMTVDAFGLKASDKDEAFEASAGTFADKEIDRATMAMLLTKADDLIDTLGVLGQHRDESVTALNLAVSEMPQQANSDDITYGFLDHTVLLMSHTKLIDKLATESVSAISVVLGTVDAALDIDTGLGA